MVHHSIAVVFTSFLTNFSEFYEGELRRILLPRTPVKLRTEGNHRGFIGPCFIYG